MASYWWTRVGGIAAIIAIAVGSRIGIRLIWGDVSWWVRIIPTVILVIAVTLLIDFFPRKREGE